MPVSSEEFKNALEALSGENAKVTRPSAVEGGYTATVTNGDKSCKIQVDKETGIIRLI